MDGPAGLKTRTELASEWMATEDFISRVFDRAKAIAIEAYKRDHHQTIALAVDVRGQASHVEATMPDGRRLRSNRDAA